MARQVTELSMGPFCVTGSNPTHHLTDPTKPEPLQVKKFGPNPTRPDQPMGQRNPWTTLCRKVRRSHAYRLPSPWGIQSRISRSGSRELRIHDRTPPVGPQSRPEADGRPGEVACDLDPRHSDTCPTPPSWDHPRYQNKRFGSVSIPEF